MKRRRFSRVKRIEAYRIELIEEALREEEERLAARRSKPGASWFDEYSQGRISGLRSALVLLGVIKVEPAPVAASRALPEPPPRPPMEDR